MNEPHQKRETDKARRREEIIDAAEQLAIRQDWSQVTVGAVARHAGLSRALLYIYFENKTDLHAAILDRARKELLGRFKRALGTFTGLNRFIGIGQAYVDFARECPHYFEAISRFEAAPDVSDEVVNTSSLIANPVHQLIVQTLSEEIKNGNVRADLKDLELVALNLWAFTHGLIQISSNKRNQLEIDGIQNSALMHSAFELIIKSIAA